MENHCLIIIIIFKRQTQHHFRCPPRSKVAYPTPRFTAAIWWQSLFSSNITKIIPSKSFNSSLRYSGLMLSGISNEKDQIILSNNLAFHLKNLCFKWQIFEKICRKTFLPRNHLLRLTFLQRTFLNVSRDHSLVQFQMSPTHRPRRDSPGSHLLLTVAMLQTVPGGSNVPHLLTSHIIRIKIQFDE